MDGQCETPLKADGDISAGAAYGGQRELLLVFLNGVKGSETVQVSVLLRKRECGSAAVKGDEVPAEQKQLSICECVCACE